MKQKKLIINQKNYEGYNSLYNIKSRMSNGEYKNCVNSLKKAFISFLIGAIVIMATPLFCGGLALKSIFLTEFVTMLIIEGGFSIEFLIKAFTLKKEKVKSVKEVYPYVDTNVDLDELQESLKKYKSNEFDKNNDVCFVGYDSKDKNEEQLYSKYHNTHHLREGGVCFENISKTEYDNFSNKTESDNYYQNNKNQETEKNKVKTLIR